MRTTEEAAKEFLYSDKEFYNSLSQSERDLIIPTFEAGVKFAQTWIPVEEEIECNIDIDGIMYSEDVLLKVNNFEFQLVGCYMRANDDEFWEIYGLFEVEQSDITHYRLIELK